MPMTIVAHADHPAIGGVQGGEQGRCPMPFIVVGHSSAAALVQGQAGLRAVQGLNLAFLIHAQNYSMFGRMEIKPTMASSFSANCGSLLTLKVLARCGFSPWVCQMRRTVDSLTPAAAAMVRVLQ